MRYLKKAWISLSVSILSLVMAMTLLVFVGQAQAAEVIDLKANILNHPELPKVLYIVPWKRPAQGDFALPPPPLVLPGADLAPVDRDVFVRQIKNASLLTTRPAETAAPGR